MTGGAISGIENGFPCTSNKNLDSSLSKENKFKMKETVIDSNNQI
jgi:hypothetical protein